MGWETRRGRRYYYRATKVGGRVVKEYVGAGPLAEIAAAADAQARANRAALAEARRRERAELETVEAPYAAFVATLESLTLAGLLLAGYHRHHGGEWRRRRHG